MKAFEIIDPAGVLHNGGIKPKGEIITSASITSQITAWLHFKQVKEIEYKEPAEDSDKADSKKPHK